MDKRFLLIAAWLGAITPMGGVFFIAGWILLALGIRQGKAA
ncbi:MAG: hypothetical protein AAB212_01445 [Bacteroidota bacterium]